MATIRLIRAVPAPTGRGPGNGQFALQRGAAAICARVAEDRRPARARRNPLVLVLGRPRDRRTVRRTGTPFVAGPNVLFEHSRQPCRVQAEREICDAASCRLLFTESEWYRRLIEGCRGPANRAPIVVWPYPIHPRPGGPLPPQYDLLIYEKSGVNAATVARLQRAWPRHARIRYGRYRREQLWAVARRSRCCLYLSDDDRGPLALAEILLSGCPAVGISRGAPFVEPGRTGAVVERLDAQSCLEAVAGCRQLDRRRVSEAAAVQFDARRIVGVIAAALEGL